MASRLALGVARWHPIDVDYQHERHNDHLVVYHIIWCPKRRRKVLVGPVRNRLKQLIEEVVAEEGWQIISLAIQPDHVHLFIRATPYTLPSDIPRLIKGRSSHDLREGFPPPDEAAVSLDSELFSRHGGHRQPGDHPAKRRKAIQNVRQPS